MANWTDVTLARSLWADARTLDDLTLNMLLSSAHNDCFTYLDPVDGIDPQDDAVTDSMRLAEIYQARARYNALSSAGDGNQVGVDGVTVTVFPLDWQVQQLLRPREGRISTA